VGLAVPRGGDTGPSRSPRRSGGRPTRELSLRDSVGCKEQVVVRGLRARHDALGRTSVQCVANLLRGRALEFVCRYSAATPAACGVAIEVPLIVFVAFALVYHEDVMPTPGT